MISLDALAGALTPDKWFAVLDPAAIAAALRDMASAVEDGRLIPQKAQVISRQDVDDFRMHTVTLRLGEIGTTSAMRDASLHAAAARNADIAAAARNAGGTVTLTEADMAALSPS